MPAKSPKPSKKLEKELRDLGQRLRSRRKDLGISATVVAEAAEISRVTLFRIEKGEPSVTMGAYLAVVSALGCKIDFVDPLVAKTSEVGLRTKLPKKIPISSYKELKRLAWQMKDTQTLTPHEALDLYERNWRHVDFKSMDNRERDLIESLLAAFGRERLLV